mmetsp:Transcript_22495/g.48849  ORF Transcript_22495/g.48849 Transcript_22495/m.48849 type:complete len:91 (+) Transcript_22495:887-1159(+)
MFVGEDRADLEVVQNHVHDRLNVMMPFLCVFGASDGKSLLLRVQAPDDDPDDNPDDNGAADSTLWTEEEFSRRCSDDGTAYVYGTGRIPW